MYATLVIAISCVVSIIFLSKANIKVTITHNYPQPHVDKVDNSLPVDVEKLYEQEDIPTFDDVLKVAQELIGGESDVD